MPGFGAGATLPAMRPQTTAVLALLLGACGPRSSALERATDELDQAHPQGIPLGSATTPSAHAPSEPPATASSAPSNSSPPVDRHVSRSAGETGGVIVLWPRVIPRGVVAPEVARRVQGHMAELARVTLPTRPVDVRPEPQRTCPSGGCNATAIGVLLSGQGGRCIAVATVAAPGTSEATLLPWGGQVTIKDIKIPNGEAPESQIRIREGVACDRLLDDMSARDEAIARALHASAD